MKNIKLIYGYDPLCGWCYAFSKEMSAVQATLPELTIDVVYGGLVVGERVGSIKDHAEYLLRGEQQLMLRTSTIFGDQFKSTLLKDGTYISNSEPPCRAVWVMQKLNPTKAFAFANELPTAHYWNGVPLDDPDQLAIIAHNYGVEKEQFIEAWHSEEAKDGVIQAFQLARASGVVSYPTLWLEKDGTREIFVEGWQKSDQIIEQLNHVL